MQGREAPIRVQTAMRPVVSLPAGVISVTCPSRHFPASQQFGRFWSEADIELLWVLHRTVAIDPEETWSAN